MQRTFITHFLTPSDQELYQTEHLTGAFPAEPVLLATDSSGGAGGGKRETQKEDNSGTGKIPSSAPQPMGESENETENNAGEGNDPGEKTQ